MKNHVEKRFMHANPAVVLDKAKLPEAIYEEVHPGSRRSNRVG